MIRLATIVTESVLFWALLTGLPTFARTQNPIAADRQGMYSAALRSGLNEMSRAWGKLDMTERGHRIPIDFGAVVVQKDSSITDGLDSQFDDHQVTYMDNRGLISRWKNVRKEFPIFVIRPVYQAGGVTNISIQLCWVSYGKGKLLIAIDSWANVHFRYDTTARKYVVANVELGGV